MFSLSNAALAWIIFFTTASATVSGQGDADFLARIRSNSRNADLSDRLERLIALKNVQRPQERQRPDPSGPDAEGTSTEGPDSTVPGGLGGQPGSPGPDVTDGLGGGRTSDPDWAIAFPDQGTTEATLHTPGFFNRKTTDRSKNGNSQEISTTTTATTIDPWAKIFGSTVANKEGSTTPDFLQQTDTTTTSSALPGSTPQIPNWRNVGRGGPHPPTDHRATTTEASWEIATDSGLGANIETTTENTFGAAFETTTEVLRGFGAAFETTHSPEVTATNPFPPFPGFGAGKPSVINTQPPFPGFGGGFETTNVPQKIATDLFPPFPNNFGAATPVPFLPVPGPSAVGPNVQIPNGTSEERWRNKGPPPVPGLTRKHCEDNAAIATKYGIKDIIVWVDSNCMLAKTVFQGQSCEDFSKSARWCYA